jgi:hypothetical protein
MTAYRHAATVLIEDPELHARLVALEKEIPRHGFGETVLNIVLRTPQFAEWLRGELDRFPEAMRLAQRKQLEADVAKAPPPGISGFVPIRPLVKAEYAFAQLGRWRRLSRCYEGSEASARAWLEVASVGYLAWRAVA